MRYWLRIVFTGMLAVSSLMIATPQSIVLSSPVAVAPDTEGVQVPIPMNCRVKNRSGVQCVWCSIECLGRYHKVAAVINLTDTHKHPSSEGPTRQVLNRLGVKYLMNHTGDPNKQFLEDACAKGWGAAVGLSGTHMVNIVHFKDGRVKIIDNSDPSLGIRTMSESRFMERWDGWAITLVPPGRPGDGVPQEQRPIPPVPPGPLPLAPRPPSAIR